MMIRLIISMFLMPAMLYAKTVNVYVFGGEIPESLIRRFEAQTGIDVNFSTYDSNETLYAKLKASKTPLYDVIMPSAYYVERMRQQNMLETLDQQKIKGMNQLIPMFLHQPFDPKSEYAVPMIWGITGIFYNTGSQLPKPSRWSDLWALDYKNQLMLLDDVREVFSMALLSLGYSANDTSPLHIKEAYQQLLRLGNNIKLFASDSIQAVMIDEDALIGMSWNGDVLKAKAENKHIDFIFPEEGFVIWVDCLAIPKEAPHLDEAYAFINFMLEPEQAIEIAQKEGHAITNRDAIVQLPPVIKNNKLIYPDEETLKRGQFQQDIPDEILQLYSQYWQQFKLSL